MNAKVLCSGEPLGYYSGENRQIVYSIHKCDVSGIPGTDFTNRLKPALGLKFNTICQAYSWLVKLASEDTMAMHSGH